MKLKTHEGGIDPDREDGPVGEKTKTEEEELLDCLLDLCEDADHGHGITVRTIVVMMKQLGVSYPPMRIAAMLKEQRRVHVVKE